MRSRMSGAPKAPDFEITANASHRPPTSRETGNPGSIEPSTARARAPRALATARSVWPPVTKSSPGRGQSSSSTGIEAERDLRQARMDDLRAGYLVIRADETEHRRFQVKFSVCAYLHVARKRGGEPRGTDPYDRAGQRHLLTNDGLEVALRRSVPR